MDTEIQKINRNGRNEDSNLKKNYYVRLWEGIEVPNRQKEQRQMTKYDMDLHAISGARKVTEQCDTRKRILRSVQALRLLSVKKKKKKERA
jgi:hypothetical protein